MAMATDGQGWYFSTQDANFLRHQFCRRTGMTREQFYEWIHVQSKIYTNKAIAQWILDTAPTRFAEVTVRKWVGHWVRDARQELDQVSIWMSL